MHFELTSAQRAELRTACDALLTRLPSVTDSAVTAGFAAAPGIALSGPKFTDAGVREHNQDPVRLFLMMARDLATEVPGGHAEQLQINAREWAAEGMQRGVITPHQVVRFSAAAHTSCLRSVVAALPDRTLPALLGPVAAWHTAYSGRTAAQADSLLRIAPGYPMQRAGDQWRNWVLESALTEGVTSLLDTNAPAVAGLLAMRTPRHEVEAVLARSTRPPWWWTVYRAKADMLLVVVDAAEAPQSWAEDTLDCIAPGRSALGAVAYQSGPRERLTTLARLVLGMTRTAPPGPVVRSRMMTGMHVRVIEALLAHGVDKDLGALVGALREGPDLLQTVTTYLRCDLRATKTADLLGIHRSTVEYRLARIAAQSGIDPRTTSGAAVWWSALTVGRLPDGG